MKETINYYYNFDIDIIENNNSYYSFFYMGVYYYFVFFNRTEEELKDILDITKELKLKNIAMHDIVLNRFSSPLTRVGELDYILLKIMGDKNQTFDIVDINELNNKLILNNASSKLYRNNWSELWSKKNDYLESQIRELGKNKTIILDSFSYYIGLSENAISYITRINELNKDNKERIVLSHRRIFYPNTKLNYLNPLSLIFDLEVRDVAEYIKAAFFNNEDAFLELSTYLKMNKLSNYSYHMLYGRLLYPTYYFDVYDSIMNNNEDEEKLLNIIKKVDDYELFLKDVYFEINKYTTLDRIDWIIKKEL